MISSFLWVDPKEPIFSLPSPQREWICEMTTIHFVPVPSTIMAKYYILRKMEYKVHAWVNLPSLTIPIVINNLLPWTIINRCNKFCLLYQCRYLIVAPIFNDKLASNCFLCVWNVLILIDLIKFWSTTSIVYRGYPDQNYRHCLWWATVKSVTTWFLFVMFSLE